MHRSNMKEAGIVITAGQVFHPPYVSKDPDKLPQYISEKSVTITVPDQDKYHDICRCTPQPVEVVEFLADAVHNAKAAWKQNLLKIVAKVRHCLKAVLLDQSSLSTLGVETMTKNVEASPKMFKNVEDWR